MSVDIEALRAQVAEQDKLLRTDALTSAIAYISSVLADGASALPVLAQTTARLYEIAEVLEELKVVAKERVTARLQAEGKRVTEKGTLRLTDPSGWTFEARPTNTGFDPRRVEALVRAKGLDPQRYMQATLIYKVDPDGMARLQKDGHATADELETCRYSMSYTVMRPVRGGK